MNFGPYPPAPKRYTCRKCGYSAFTPMMRPVGNPRHKFEGRCSNRRECKRRQLRAKASR
jgi:hypothetical protein